MQDDVFEIRRVFGNGIDDGVAEIIAKLVPIETGLELVGRVLHKT